MTKRKEDVILCDVIEGIRTCCLLVVMVTVLTKLSILLTYATHEYTPVPVDIYFWLSGSGIINNTQTNDTLPSSSSHTIIMTILCESHLYRIIIFLLLLILIHVDHSPLNMEKE